MVIRACVLCILYWIEKKNIMNIFHRKHQFPAQNNFPGLNISLFKNRFLRLQIYFPCLKKFPYSKIYFHDSKIYYTFAGNIVSLRVLSAAPLDFKVFLCQQKVFLWQKVFLCWRKYFYSKEKYFNAKKSILCLQKVYPCKRKPAYLLVNENMTNHMLRSNNE